MSNATNEMTVAEIIEAISIPGPYQRDVVAAALAQREAIIPELIFILEQLRRNPADFPGEVDYLYALFLLSHFEVTAAHALMADLLRLQPEWVNLLFDELITEKFAAFLYRTYDDDPEPAKALVADRAADAFCRAVGATVLAYAVADARLDREAVLTFLRDLLAAEAAENVDSALYSLLVRQLSELYPAAQMDLIRQLYAAERIDPRSITLDEIEEIVKSSNPEEALAALRIDARTTQSDNLPDELAEWLEGFTDEPEQDLMRLAAASRRAGAPKGTTKKSKNKRKMAKASRKKNRRK